MDETLISVCINLNLNHMKKYEKGYLPKLAYHLSKGNTEKYSYFLRCQIEVYGAITDEQRWWVLEETHKLTEAN